VTLSNWDDYYARLEAEMRETNEAWLKKYDEIKDELKGVREELEIKNKIIDILEAQAAFQRKLQRIIEE
jgi:hypothetical protein